MNGENEIIRKFYFAGSTQVGVRVNGTLMWVLSDHLGSTSVTANADGTIKSEIRYTAFGEVRSSSGDTPTPYQYTGQLSQMEEIGLYYYVARWYDPVTAHFAQADTIVAEGWNAIAYDRYSYVLSNPIIHTDPTGHCYDTSQRCLDRWKAYGNQVVTKTLSSYNITISGSWSDRNIATVISAANSMGRSFAQVIGGSPEEAFSRVFKKGVSLTWGTSGAGEHCYVNGEFSGGGCTNSATSINFASLAQDTKQIGGTRSEYTAYPNARNNVIHELYHAFANIWYSWDSTKEESVYKSTGPKFNIPSTFQHERGFLILPDPDRLTWRQHPGDIGPDEIFADMGVGWTYHVWDHSLDSKGVNWGAERDEFMTIKMTEWLNELVK